MAETRGAAPSLAGCECPAVAADGTVYAASWYAGRGAAPEPAWATPEACQSLEAGPAAAVSPDDVAVDMGGGGGGGAVVEEKSFLRRMYALLLWLFGAGPKKETSTQQPLVEPKPAAGGSSEATAVCAVQ